MTGISLRDRIDQGKAENGFQTQISAEVNKILEAGLAEVAVAGWGEHRDIRKRDKIRSMLAKAKIVFKRVFSVIWKFQEFLMPMATSIPLWGLALHCCPNPSSYLSKRLRTTTRFRKRGRSL